MRIFSDLLLRMYKKTIQNVTNQQADAIVDAKFVLDYYLEHNEWPAVFYVYYHKHATNILLPNTKVGSLTTMHYAYNIDPNGVLVKYSFKDDHYESEDVSVSELIPELQTAIV